MHDTTTAFVRSKQNTETMQNRNDYSIVIII